MLLVTGCTSVGLHDPATRLNVDFGPPQTVALCLYVDDGISETEARTLIDDAWRDDATAYGLTVTVATVVRWPRPAFSVDGIIDALRIVPLEPGCDRILALIGRHIGDFIWGLLG